MNKVSFFTWIKAARLRTIPLSISGILVGSSIAFQKNEFDLVVFVFAILTTVSYQLLSNFANDYGDGVKGTDNSSRLGPKRILQSGLITRDQLRQTIFSITETAILATKMAISTAETKDSAAELIMLATKTAGILATSRFLLCTWQLAPVQFFFTNHGH